MAKGYMHRIGIVGIAVAALFMMGIPPAIAEDPLPPSAPRNPAVSTTLLTGLLVEWDPPSSDGGHAIQAYTVYRSYDNVSFIAIGVVGATQLTLEDQSVKLATYVVYHVTATNGYGEGEASLSAASPGFSDDCRAVTLTYDGSLPRVRPECVGPMTIRFS